MNSKQRFTISLPEDLSQKLNQMSRDMHISKSDLLRNAVGLYMFLYNEVREKKHDIVVRSKEEGDRQLIFTGVL